MKKSYHTKKALIERAKWLRKNQSRPERRLWSRLRRKQLGGYKFRRQHILEPFIVDFYCTSCRVVVEVDGPHHQEKAQKTSDKSRDERLCEDHDVEVLRFDVMEVYDDLDGVLETILEACEGDGGLGNSVDGEEAG